MADEYQDALDTAAEEARRRATQSPRALPTYPTSSNEYQNALSAAAGQTTPPQPNVRAVEYAQRGLPVEGEQNAPGFTGANTIQGTLSPQEQQFWAANPMGAVKDPITGNLIGLGDNPQKAQATTDTAYAQIGLHRIGTQPGEPGFGGPQPATQFQPQMITDADIHNPVIQSRMDEIDNELALRTSHLRGLSTQRPRHGGPSEYDKEVLNIKMLQGARKTLQAQQHQFAEEKLQTIKYNNTVQQRIQDTSTEGEMRHFMYGIDPRQYPPGSFQRDQLIRQNLNPAWLDYLNRNKEFAKEFSDHIKGHEDIGLIMQQLQQSGGKATMTSIGPRGAQYRVEEAGAVPNNVQERYIRLQASILQHQEQSDAEKQANVKGGKANVPYSKAPALHADQLEAQRLEERFPGLRPGAQSQPSATPTSQTSQGDLTAPTNPSERVADSIYTTPKGPLRWTGTGWVKP